MSLLPAVSSVIAEAEPSATSDQTKIVRTQDDSADNPDETVSKTEISRVRVQSGDNTAQQPGESGDVVEKTVITEKQEERGGLRDEAVGIKPQFGFVNLNDLTGENATRAVGGLTIDINALRRAGNERGRPYFGPSIGILYSHLGAPGADFFGLNSPTGQNAGTSLLMFPLNLKAGYTFRNAARLSIHGGANVLYTNTSGNAEFGPVTVSANRSTWETHPNLGFDIELGLGTSVALLLRPDWTFAQDTDIFTGTFGLAFPIS